MVTLVAWLLACAPEDPCAQPMHEGDGGLAVTEAEHPDGWGDAACTECHAIEALHLVACVPGVDLAEVRERAAAGDDACVECHGDNGVAR